MGIATLAVAPAPGRRGAMRRPAAAGALAALGLLASAGTVAGQMDHGGAGVGGPAVDPPGGIRSIAVTDKGVVPLTAVVAPGTEVVWRNAGRTLHTVTETEGRWESGSLAPGGQFTIRAPIDSGAYRYYCRFHPSIRGVLTVSALDLQAPETVTFGTRAGLAGTVPNVEPGTMVTIERRLPGHWEAVAHAETDADGAFGTSTPSLSSGGAFRAVSGEAVSPSVRIGVRPLVAVTLRGSVVRARVQPGRAGARVVLERLSLETYTWTVAGRGRLGANRTARVRATQPGVYRVRVPHAGPSLAEGVSAPVEHRPDGYRDR
jgi:plastocyanin